MKITKYPDGWKVEPDTNDEERALEFILNAFQETYCKISSTGAEQATDLLLPDPAQSMEISA